MNFRKQKINKQLCQPRWSVYAHACAYIDAKGRCLVVSALSGKSGYRLQDNDESGIT